MQMSETQLEFFRELNAPFGPDDLYTTSKGGRQMTYVKAPTLMNRLDDVAGPAGWDVEYRPTERGYTCRLGILVPVGKDDEQVGDLTVRNETCVWHYKEDGGGFEGMTRKVGSENVPDEDNDEKSGYTNAFRRACYAWGIGRDLWRCGIPQYLGRDPVVPDVPVESRSTPRQPSPGPNSPRQYPATAARQPAPRPRPQQQQQQQGNYDNFKPPTRAGKAAYAWLKGLENHFGEGVVKVADGIAKENGFPYKSFEWDESMLETITWGVIDEIREGWDNYQGEFDHLEDPRMGG